MRPSDIRKANQESVLRAILNGNDTFASISQITSLSYATLTHILLDLRKSGAILSANPKCMRSGRRTLHYSVNDKYYTCLIVDNTLSLDMLHINAYNKVLKKYSFSKIVSSNLNEVLSAFLSYFRATFKESKYCVDFFVSTKKENLIAPFIKMDMKETVMKYISCPDSIDYFDFMGDCYCSLYGHILQTDTPLSELKKILPIKKEYRYQTEFCYEIFESIQEHTLQKILQKAEKS